MDDARQMPYPLDIAVTKVAKPHQVGRKEGPLANLARHDYQQVHAQIRNLARHFVLYDSSYTDEQDDRRRTHHDAGGAQPGAVALFAKAGDRGSKIREKLAHRMLQRIAAALCLVGAEGRSWVLGPEFRFRLSGRLLTPGAVLRILLRERR